mgnify:CR=1 FL=1
MESKPIIKDIEITRGIPVLNYSPGSFFTPEFDPYSSQSSYSSDMSEQNIQQVNDVISSVKVGIQQYLNQLDNNYQVPKKYKLSCNNSINLVKLNSPSP